ncbi:MAG: GIY-YIG nuclease family protein [Candidatus Peregrinibacteria bacterium]|nr:GIY-YIG nuclease family protein [Candidatus Peregrinibacteria bacterium]
MYYLYILECADNTLYTGITVDLERRIKEHNTSKLGAKYTAARRPVYLVYSKKFRNRSTASKAESQVKGLHREEKLELIKKPVYNYSNILTSKNMAKGKDSRKEKKKPKKDKKK